MSFSPADLQKLQKQLIAAKKESKAQSLLALKRIGVIGSDGKLDPYYRSKKTKVKLKVPGKVLVASGKGHKAP